MDKFTLENYNNWLTSDYIDLKDREDLESIKENETEIEVFFARPNSLFLKSKATGNFLSYPSPDSFNLLLDPLNNTK
ncbi:hypothetical protein HS141_14385 [Cetobacterium somerae]|uniref:hypothetical protein n=1 Tax=Cetobacterium somerae TaxID=188913 RepID=UPI00211DA65F|nr:hypothetical protein [Cetobacterium somerae]MCQ9628105.1 hypothetical protein [Cetobacterium somerae]